MDICRIYVDTPVRKIGIYQQEGSTNGVGDVTRGYACDLAGNRISKTVNDLEVSYSTNGVGNRLEGWNVSAPGGQMYRRVSGISSETVGTDARWGQLWISNTVTQVSTFPGISGTNFYTDQIPLVSGTQNIIAAIRDQAGNMGYVTNTLNCSLVTNALVAYNAAGCTTNITHQGPGYTTALALGWNEQYQLTNVQRSTSNVLHSAISYSYDLLSRRASRTQDGISEYYVYDGDHVAFDLDASRRLKRFYAYGPGVDNVLFMQTYSSGGSLLATYYYIKDHQNTVLALADSSGNIVESYEYDAWGRVLAVKDTSGNELTSDLGLPISAIGNRYTFQGREIDWETGLTYFRARWYNPVSGRWLSKDPIGISGGLNLYAFCGNNPVNFVDPSGLWTLQFGVSSTAGTGGGGTSGFGVAMSYSRDAGFQIGSYGTVGGGVFAGSGGSLTIDLSLSRNDSIHDLAGAATSSGVSVGEWLVGGFEGIVPTNEDDSESVTFSFGFGAGPSPAEGHIFDTTTDIRQWNSNM